MGSKAQAKANSEYAKYMKDRGIVRRTARCPICTRIIAVPTDRHFYGAVCY